MRPVFTNIRRQWLRFQLRTINPMSPYVGEIVHKLAAIEGPGVRLPKNPSTWRT